MLGVFVFIPTCSKTSFGFANVIPATATYTFTDSTRNMFDLIFQTEQGFDIPGVPDYLKVVLIICENKKPSVSLIWGNTVSGNRKSGIIFSSSIEAPETVSPHYEYNSLAWETCTLVFLLNSLNFIIEIRGNLFSMM